MRLHWIQHVPFEDLGAIEGWIRKQGWLSSCTRQWAGDPLPAVDDVDGVIVMGGPMGVGQVDRYPWIRAEIEWIARHLADNKPTLGICLGAQMMASALGAAVYPGSQREVGWFELTACSDRDELFVIPDRFLAYHWHGETFDLPDGARRLAGSVACANQVVALGTHALALQCHLEMTAAGAQRLAEHCPDDLTPGHYVQSIQEQLLDPSLFSTAHGILEPLLHTLFARKP